MCEYWISSFLFPFIISSITDYFHLLFYLFCMIFFNIFIFILVCMHVLYVCMFVCMWYLGKIVMGRVYLKYCLAIKEDILNSYPEDTSFLSWDINTKQKQIDQFFMLRPFQCFRLSVFHPLHLYHFF